MRIATLHASTAVYDAMMPTASPDIAAMHDPMRQLFKSGRIMESR
jgi:hypothetical protein